MTAEEAARAMLPRLMSDHSEDLYCAGWMADIEHTLWGIIHDPADLSLTEVEKATLLWASDTCGGWFRWPRVDGHPHPDGPLFVPLAEWEREYAAGLELTRRELERQQVSKR